MLKAAGHVLEETKADTPIKSKPLRRGSIGKRRSGVSKSSIGTFRKELNNVWEKDVYEIDGDLWMVLNKSSVGTPNILLGRYGMSNAEYRRYIKNYVDVEKHGLVYEEGEESRFRIRLFGGLYMVMNHFPKGCIKIQNESDPNVFTHYQVLLKILEQLENFRESILEKQKELYAQALYQMDVELRNTPVYNSKGKMSRSESSRASKDMDVNVFSLYVPDRDMWNRINENPILASQGSGFKHTVRNNILTSLFTFTGGGAMAYGAALAAGGVAAAPLALGAATVAGAAAGLLGGKKAVDGLGSWLGNTRAIKKLKAVSEAPKDYLTGADATDMNSATSGEGYIDFYNPDSSEVIARRSSMLLKRESLDVGAKLNLVTNMYIFNLELVSNYVTNGVRGKGSRVGVVVREGKDHFVVLVLYDMYDFAEQRVLQSITDIREFKVEDTYPFLVLHKDALLKMKHMIEVKFQKNDVKRIMKSFVRVTRSGYNGRTLFEILHPRLVAGDDRKRTRMDNIGELLLTMRGEHKEFMTKKQNAEKIQKKHAEDVFRKAIKKRRAAKRKENIAKLKKPIPVKTSRKSRRRPYSR